MEYAVEEFFPVPEFYMDQGGLIEQKYDGYRFDYQIQKNTVLTLDFFSKIP